MHWPSHRSLRAPHLLLCLLLGMLSCDSSTTGPSPRDEVRTVEIQSSVRTVPIGGTVDLVAIVRSAGGAELRDRDIVWSTRDPTVVQLTPLSESSVRVRGLTAGTARVSASSERVDAEVEIVVTGQVETVEVIPATTSLVQGGNMQFEARARDARGQTILNPAVAWSTANSGVATVSASGLVVGMGPGTTQITATADGKSGVSQVTITAAPVATIVVTPDPATVAVDRALQFRATMRDAAGNDLGVRPVVWVTSNPAVLSIDASGNATGRAVGTATITATSEGKSATAQASVVPASALLIEVAPAARIINAGDTVHYRATQRDGNGNIVSLPSVSWISSDPSVVTILGSGVATGVSPGVATITATSGDRTGNTQLSVRAPVPQLSGIAPDSAQAGRATELALTVHGAGFTRTSRIRWNGTDRPTSFVNDGRLQGTVPASDFATAGSAQVTVFTPAPGGGTSSPATFRIRGTGTYVLGDTAAGSIDPPGTSDEFTFAATGPQEVNVYFQAASGDDNDRLQLRLYDPSANSLGSLLSTGDDRTLEGQSLPRVRLTRTGTYTLRIQAYNTDDGGPYRFYVAPIRLSPERVPAVVTVDSEVVGEDISPVGDVDVFTFTGTAGQDLNVFFQGMSGVASDALYLNMYDPRGSRLLSIITSGAAPTLEGQHSGRFTLQQNGTYTLRVEGGNASDDGGPYRFKLIRISRAPEHIPSAVATGAIVSGEDINPLGDLDRFTFAGTAGQEVNVYFQAMSGTSRDRLQLRVLDAEEESLGSVPSYGSDGSLDEQAISHLRLPRTGTYVVEVTGFNSDDGGPYRFRIRPIDVAPERRTETVVLGTMVSGEDISPVGDVDRFTFAGTAGQAVNFQFQATSGSFTDELYLYVYTPGGNQLLYIYSDGSDSALQQSGRVVLPQTGTYILRVRGANSSNDGGPYRFQVVPVQ